MDLTSHMISFSRDVS